MGGEIDTSNLVQSFAVYGLGIVMRPVGGITIGYIGDKYGRKQALVLSLFLMAIPTFLMWVWCALIVADLICSKTY